MKPEQNLAIERAVAILARGGLVAFPTETVYGLGAAAGNPQAVRRVFAVKRRPAAHPLIVHISNSSELGRVAREVPPVAERLAARFWPGPLTLILPRGSEVPLEVTGGQETVAVRVPNHPVALALLAEFGAGIAAPSANRFGAVSPTRAEHVRTDLGSDVDLVLDGGPCAVGLESTIVDVSRGAARLLRPGGVAVEALEAELGERLQVAGDSSVRAPGQLESHYATRAKLMLATPAELVARTAALSEAGAKVAVLAPIGTEVPSVATSILVPAHASGYAHLLYESLRELDSRGVDAILVVAPNTEGLGLAVVDRLSRAAAPRPGDTREER
ncbi:MAG TPA: L-threonylcarbamoyladenylate synthase [Polyangiaceae bacterium]|nr:L-threonylcarbamoyladenylate synthase [Polyangiaceae bacterium]